MNRFRQLKQKLIKSKRDSQKLQHLPSQQKELQAWVQKQLQYYGISRQSYRLKQLKQIYQLKQCSESGNKQNPQSQSSIDSVQRGNQRAFSKKNISFDNIQDRSSSISFGQKESDERTNESKTVTTKRFICKKVKQHQHVSSMNDVDDILSKEHNEGIYPTKQSYSNFQSCQVEGREHHFKQTTKQLDYYTLILQLTAELNYSRLNKQSSNEKSILNQIKNLISYIEGKSATQTGAESGQMHSSDQTHSKLQSHTNKKSCHTFSSVFSNESMGNQIEYPKHNQESPSKRRIRYKLMQPSSEQAKQSIYQNSINNKHYESQNDIQDEQNQTFKSINGFQEDNDESDQDQEDKTSIIDMVNNGQQSNNEILIEDSDEYPNVIIENSPLSRITEHQSEYSESVDPSITQSPSKYTPQKHTTPIQQLFNPTEMQKHISNLYSQSIFKKSSFQRRQEEKLINSLPQNEMILKKLSDKLENTDQMHHLFEHSLEFKRILYMLDSEYSSSDLKNRTCPSILEHTLSWPQNHSASEKSISLYCPKTQSDISPQSFSKQIFESHGQSVSEKRPHNSKCLMTKLDALFHSQCKNQSKSPKLLKFESQNQHESQSSSERFRKHERSYTSGQHFPQEKLNQTRKYRFNILSELSQQANLESEENMFDHEKYQPLKTEYDDESVYHKQSRDSYLTSSPQYSNPPTSSQSEIDGFSKPVRKGNLIVKKNKDERNSHSRKSPLGEEKQSKLIVKKKSKTMKTQYSEDSQITERLQGQHKQNFQHRDFLKKTVNSQMNKDISKEHSRFSNKKKQFTDFSISVQKFQCEEQSFASSNCKKSNCKDLSKSKTSTDRLRSPSLNESKASINSNRPIKYKVHKIQNEIRGPSQRQDKRKVLKDIVSILNSKYNKNIQIRE